MKKQTPAWIGVDIGGTLIKLGIVQGKRILLKREIPTTPIAQSPSVLVSGLVQEIQFLRKGSAHPIVGIGVGVPGLVEHSLGIVDSCANLPGWKHFPLKKQLERRLHLPVRVDNDVNVMCLAEWRFGAGRGMRHLVCLTLGTGVGGGLILDGQLYRGWGGSAGELGHMPVAPSGKPCPCGGRACLERYVGNREIIQWVKQQLPDYPRSQIRRLVNGDLRKLTPEILDRACVLADPLARKAWARVGHLVGVVLASVVNLLNPQRIVVGGGISKAGNWILGPMRQTVAQRAMRGVGKVTIVPASLGASAGLIGAASLFQQDAG